jgi:RHS repeat-associated protein
MPNTTGQSKPQAYTPEGEGRVNLVSGGSQNPVTATSYNLFSLPTGLTFGSGDSDAFQYDNNTGRMTQYKANINGQSAYGTMTWNPNGSLYSVALTDPINLADVGTCQHTYDDLARVSQVNCVNGNWGQNFTYDPFGNIRKQQFGGYGNGTFLPTYDQTSNRYQLMADGFTPTYDTNGNLLTYTTGHSYSWDAEGSLYQLDAGTAMVYDALGRRMEQPNGSVILYGPAGSKLAVMGNAVLLGNQAVQAAFIPLPGGATAVYTASGLSRYRHPDWLGTARFASKPDRTVYYDGPYSPYGESYGETGTTDRNFTGQNQDLTPNGDLYDFLYREFHAPHGRWISPDPAGRAAASPGNPQSWNRYAYVNGDPLRRKDLKGLCMQWFSPQTGAQGDCTNAGLMAYGLNSDVFDSWTNAPGNGLGNQGAIFDVDIAGRDQQRYGKNMAFMFWTGVVQWAANNFANGNTGLAQTYAEDVAYLSGGAVDPNSVHMIGGLLGWNEAAQKMGQEVFIELSPGTPGVLGPAGTPGPPPSTGDQVSATPVGGPTSMTAPMALPFAPDPTYVKGYCPTGYHWQPYPFNPAAGACYLSGPLQPMP